MLALLLWVTSVKKNKANGVNAGGLGDLLGGILGGAQQQAQAEPANPLNDILGSVLGMVNNLEADLGDILGSVLGGGNQNKTADWEIFLEEFLEENNLKKILHKNRRLFFGFF